MLLVPLYCTLNLACDHQWMGVLYKNSTVYNHLAPIQTFIIDSTSIPEGKEKP